jgi:hydroxymethylglutaryl-CoA reductase
MSHRLRSRLRGFYRLDRSGRRAVVRREVGCSTDELAALCGRSGKGLTAPRADQMVESCIGIFGLPLGLGTNLRVDDRDRLVPMAVEEPSVVAGFSHGAKLLRVGAGISTHADPPRMIGQIQLLDVADPLGVRRVLGDHEVELLAQANTLDPALVAAGGGARSLEVRVLEPDSAKDPLGTVVVVHLIVDVCDAMGANAVNTMVEGIAPDIVSLTGGRVRLRILSNLADRRLVTARGWVRFERLGRGDGARGRAVAEGIEEASRFAERDPYRAATHNKGVMNGIDAVLVATGQDWRAVEAGAHAYAARSGRYTALSRWRVTSEVGPTDEDPSQGLGQGRSQGPGGALYGELTLPLAVGTVGGVARAHPAVDTAIHRLLGAEGATSLARVIAACGLAQNLAALRALATEGIQSGHMKLHARKGAGAVRGLVEVGG